MARALLILCLMLWPASRVQAAALPDGGITAQEMADRLRAAGFPAEQSTDRDGDPLLKSAYEGTRFSIYFYECDHGSRCKSIQFAAGWEKVGTTQQRIAEWNRTKRFGRAYLDRTNDPWVEMDVDLEHGATIEAVANDIDRWRAVLRDYRKFLGQ
jgi:hypothetical protein